MRSRVTLLLLLGLRCATGFAGERVQALQADGPNGSVAAAMEKLNDRKLNGRVKFDASPGQPIISVTLTNTQGGDGVLAQLKSLPKLRILHLNQSQVTDTGMVHVAELSGLQELDLNNSRVKDKGVLQIKGLTKLQVLRLSSIQPETMAELKGMTELRELLMNQSPGDRGMEHIAGFTKLTKLTLFGRDYTDKGLVHLKGFTELQELSLSSTSIKGEGLTQLPNLTKLRSLDLSASPIGSKALLAVKGMKDLETLSLKGGYSTIVDADLQNLQGLSKLRHLDLLGHEKLTEKGFAHLKDLPSLEILDLGYTGITDQGLASLTKLPKLKRLFLYQTKITDAGVENLKEIKTLEYISLGNTKVTNAGLLALTKALPKASISPAPK